MRRQYFSGFLQRLCGRCRPAPGLWGKSGRRRKPSTKASLAVATPAGPHRLPVLGSRHPGCRPTTHNSWRSSMLPPAPRCRIRPSASIPRLDRFTYTVAQPFDPARAETAAQAGCRAGQEIASAVRRGQRAHRFGEPHRAVRSRPRRTSRTPGYERNVKVTRRYELAWASPPKALEVTHRPGQSSAGCSGLGKRRRTVPGGRARSRQLGASALEHARPRFALPSVTTPPRSRQ